MTHTASTHLECSHPETCAKLNDDCRWGRGDSRSFRHMMTIGVAALLDDGADVPARLQRRAELRSAIRLYTFKPGESRERDFGGFSFIGANLLFKIDAYDREYEYASPDPQDPNVTVRVMTVMLASEY
jgi:Protein of unknown function (DUF3768)